MRFGLFYEHQMPRPWAEGDEERLLSNALEQVEPAERFGRGRQQAARPELPVASRR